MTDVEAKQFNTSEIPLRTTGAATPETSSTQASVFDIENRSSPTPAQKSLIARGLAAIPSPIKRPFLTVHRWLSGPQPPRPFSIKPILPRLQSFPSRYVNLLNTRLGIPWLLLWSIICGAVFITILTRSERGCSERGFGRPVRLSCVDRFWPDTAGCGLNGYNCRPFNGDAFAFRCPANCQTVQVLESYHIGNTSIRYQTLIVGGAGNATYDHIYRGDSFICPAAIHAGKFAAGSGGSGVVRLVGEYRGYKGTLENGLQGTSFSPAFPQSFVFDGNVSSGSCEDPRWSLIALTVVYTAVVSICNASATWFFTTTFLASFFCVAMAADAPQYSDYNSVVSWTFQGLLPASFVAFVIYHFFVRRTLTNMNAAFERTVLWLGPFWVGALDNMTFELLPLQRLTPRDLVQPGALVVLIIVALVILVAAVGQAWAYRIEGRLMRLLKLYILLALLVVVLILIPGLNLRIHHYIIGLLLLPGTALQTRPSMVYQGLLMGFFVNGICRWGFDSILQTTSDLFATDLDGAVPDLGTPLVNGTTLSFAWSLAKEGYDSISIVINDVERFREYEDHVTGSFNYTRAREGEDTYFRFGFAQYAAGQGGSVGRYSEASTWLANGTWIPANS